MHLLRSEQCIVRSYLEDVDEGHDLAHEIFDLYNVGIRLENSGRKSAVELCLDSI